MPVSLKKVREPAVGGCVAYGVSTSGNGEYEVPTTDCIAYRPLHVPSHLPFLPHPLFLRLTAGKTRMLTLVLLPVIIILALHPTLPSLSHLLQLPKMGNVTFLTLSPPPTHHLMLLLPTLPMRPW